MRPNFCHVSLALVLTFLNFLQAVVGVSILLYSVWMFNQWDHHIPPHPPLSHASFPFFFINSINLPATWFIYAFMGVGIIVCCITFLGCIAAEMINGCCLCFYTLLITVLLLLEAALVGFIAIDRHWEEDLPNDPTGQLESLRSLIENNMDICKWVGIAVLVIQALSLLLALILRATISTRRADFVYEDEYVATDFDYEDEYVARGRSWEPLLNPQSGQPSGSSKGDYRVNHSDIWSSWMREKVIMPARLSGKQLFPSECEAPTPTRVWAECSKSKPKPKATPSKRKTPQSSKSGNKTQSQRLTTLQGFHTPPLAQARFKCTTKMELNKEEMEVSAYVFHIHSDPSEILVKCEDSILMRKDFNCLLPSKPVDDKILHMVALKNTWIQKKDGSIKTWVLTPNFTHDFLDGHTCDELYAKYGKDWMQCSRYLEFIYVPCNYKGNWFLTVFSIEQESVYYLSSNTADNIEKSQKTIIDGLRQLFTDILAMDEYAYIHLSKSDWKTWKFIKADGIPNTGTRTNSGLWAINFIEMDNAFHPNIIGLIDDNVVRMKTVLKLILSPFNELCGLVQSNTRSFWAKLRDDPMTI